MLRLFKLILSVLVISFSFNSSSYSEFSYYGSIDPTKHYKNLKNRSYNDKIGKKDLWIDNSIKLDVIDFKINHQRKVLPDDYFNSKSCQPFFNKNIMDVVADGKLKGGLEILYSKPLMVVGKGYDKKKVKSGAPDGAKKETEILRLWLTQYVCESENVKFKEKLANEIKLFLLKWAEAGAFMKTRKNNSDTYCCIQDAVLNMNYNMSDFLTAYLVVTKDFPDDPSNEKIIINWVKNYMKKYGNRHFKKDSVGQFFNQHAVLRDYLNLKIAILTNDNELFAKAAKRALTFLAQSTPEGVYPFTAVRGQKATWYSHEAMSDYTHLLEVLRAQDYDLYNFELAGRSYKKNAEFLMGVWMNYDCAKGFTYENYTNVKLQKGTSYKLCEQISSNEEYELLQYYAKINAGSDGRLPDRSDPKVQNLTMYDGAQIEWVIFFHRNFPDNKYSKMSQELVLISDKKKSKYRSKGHGLITSAIFSYGFNKADEKCKSLAKYSNNWYYNKCDGINYN